MRNALFLSSNFVDLAGETDTPQLALNVPINLKNNALKATFFVYFNTEIPLGQAFALIGYEILGVTHGLSNQ